MEGWLRDVMSMVVSGDATLKTLKRFFPQIDDAAAGFFRDLSGGMGDIPDHHQVDVCRGMTRQQIAHGSTNQVDTVRIVWQKIEVDVS